MADFLKTNQRARYLAGGAALVFAITMLTPQPELADYNNLLLVPELAEDLDLDLATRIHLAHLGSSLIGRLADGSNAAAQLDAYGSEAAAALNVAQATAFAQRFRAGEIVSIAQAADATLIFGWRPLGPKSAHRLLPDIRKRLDAAHKWIPGEKAALALLNHRSNAVNSAAARWLHVNSAEHRGIVSRARRQLHENAGAIGSLVP